RPKKEGLQKRRPVFRSNIDALCLHCEEAHLTEGTFVNLFELPDPDPDSLRHMLERHGRHCERARFHGSTKDRTRGREVSPSRQLRPYLWRLKDHFGRCSSCSCEAKPCA
ncbi:unnamed protein product, partial [Durusdinium trenchii]